jgi:hypothetical protein
MKIMGRYEQPAYTVISVTDEYEIRAYEPHLVAETTVVGDFESTGNLAFRRLAGFIFGRNAQNTRMNMTVPVTLAPSEEGHHVYRFVMERAYSEETVPTPLDDTIRVVTVPARHVAALRYRGGRRESRFRRAEAKLLHALEGDGIAATGPAVLAVYSGPLTPRALKRNEVLIPVASSTPPAR